MVQDPLKVPRRPLYKGSKRKSSKARIYFQDRIDSEIIKAFRRKSEVASPCPLTASKKEVPRYTFAPVIGSCKLVWGGTQLKRELMGKREKIDYTRYLTSVPVLAGTQAVSKLASFGEGALAEARSLASLVLLGRRGLLTKDKLTRKIIVVWLKLREGNDVDEWVNVCSGACSDRLDC